jgi:phage terminase small subunit
VTDVPKPPGHLSAASKRWWAAVVADFELGDHHRELLTLACEARDRGEQARKLLAKDGPVFVDRFGAPRAHPAVAIERDSRTAFARLVRELRLDDEPEDPDVRPPRLGGGR